MSNQILVEQATNVSPMRAGIRGWIAVGALSMAVCVCAFATNAHATVVPSLLTFSKASNDLPIVMPICCQRREI
ncbi:hypothetical protein [Burkholderia sp. Ac-20392]|uniref:hypothetical protein n=1 Tax=Burkholderia sp. Ac-20392 TaxID=2703905 RepID=UPI0019803D3A|nr:hypothetical protein [Burkholderia sp. Ac-20392]MBN3794112.1 hypothetical protein [Burkholderia sp. Ac-20392]